jgi:hypothetical protein
MNTHTLGDVENIRQALRRMHSAAVWVERQEAMTDG